jgi:hypothetical protein
MKRLRVPLFSKIAWDHLAVRLSLRDWWALRCTCQFLRRFFSPERFFGRVKLPEAPKWPREKLFTGYAWLFSLPPFADPLGHVPFFRKRSAVARLVQGALRALEMRRTDEGDFLLATIQPSQEWSGSHVVKFSRKADGLWWTGCHCRNG